MTFIRWEGTFTALTPIHHGGERGGTRHLMSRTTHWLPTGRTVQIPTISGGSVRGLLRRRAADLFLDALGEPLPHESVAVLRWGGVMKAIGKKEDVLSAERQAVLRDRVPVIAAFGGNGGGRVISGNMIVDSARPACTELRSVAEYYPPLPEDYAWPGVRELIGTVSHSVLPDDANQVSDPAAETGPEGKQNRFHHETLMAGSVLWHTMELQSNSPMTTAFVSDLVANWSARRPRIGGLQSRGLGRVAVNYTRTFTDAFGETALAPEPFDWRSWVAENRDEIKESLAWLK